ncbi:MAG: hypothetical protein ACOCWT_02150 [Desulfohalobiaceae bacterium]
MKRVQIPNHSTWRSAAMLHSGLAVLFIALLSGCGLTKGPGIAPASKFGSSISTAELVERSHEFTVYAFTSPRPSLILFYPTTDDWSFRIKDQPGQVVKQLTDPERIRDMVDDLEERLPYPKKYVQAISVTDPNGNQVPAGYVYLYDPTQLSLRYAEDDPNTIVVVRVLRLERYNIDLLGKDDL